MEKELNRASNWARGSCIGRGSFGSVCLAADKSDGRIFAVKSVERCSGSEPRIEALENEIRILKSFSSPYVVEYLGDDATVEAGKSSFRNLHLEYLPGGTVVDGSSSSSDVYDVEIIRSYTWCIVSALNYVHSRGIVHCDVKGKNVLVGPGVGQAKLADFGSSAEFDSGKAVAAARGSPLWMAPEVVRREYQGPESDVWSLGCTVVEMVTGELPWEDRGVDTLRRIGYCDEFPELPTQLSELGRDFVDKCLKRNRVDRWSCDQLLQHPFISKSATHDSVPYSSPRCVLDWSSSEFHDEESETEVGEEISESRADSVRERIGKLASNAGAVWESDGWEVVRNKLAIGNRAEEISIPNSRNSEYSNFVTRDDETEGAIWENSDSMGILRANSEFSGFRGGPVAGCSGASCRHGPRTAVDAGGQDFTAGDGVECSFEISLYFTPRACNSLRIIIIFCVTTILILLEIQAVHVNKLRPTITSCCFLNYLISDFLYYMVWNLPPKFTGDLNNGSQLP